MLNVLNHLDLVRVTEAAAIAAAQQVGRGDKLTADKVATDAMRDRLNKIDFLGKIVIGEGIKDKSFGLYKGEYVGRPSQSEGFERFTWDDIAYDIAVDPIEGTSPTSRGGYEAMSVVAVGNPRSLFSSECFYMKKLAIGSKICQYDIDIRYPLSDIVGQVQRATDKPYNMITFCVLDRPRHQKLIEEIRSLGCRIRLISDCDVSGAIATCVPSSGIDVYMGIGGTPEGVISAAALKCMGGCFQGILCDKDGNDDGKILSMNELAKGDVVFCGTGITDGSLLRGVRYPDGKPKTHSILMRSESKTIRWINAEHGN